MDIGIPRSVLEEIFENRDIEIAINEAPNPILSLHLFNLNDYEYSQLKESLTTYIEHSASNKITDRDAWAAGFCLVIIELYRREHSFNWSWSTINDSLGFNFPSKTRFTLINEGLDYLGLPKIPETYDDSYLENLISSLVVLSC